MFKRLSSTVFGPPSKDDQTSDDSTEAGASEDVTSEDVSSNASVDSAQAIDAGRPEGEVPQPRRRTRRAPST